MRGGGLFACGMVLLGAAVAQPAYVQSRADAEAQAGVLTALEHRDCRLAVQRLNAGLRDKLPGVMLQAGTMYEDGLCLKANWPRASAMYQAAAAAGHPAGRYRLVSGLAHTAREPAVALWWALADKAMALPADCQLSDGVRASPEAFANALAAWPATRLAACSHAAGVVAALLSEVEFPGDVLNRMLEGDIGMRYLPAAGRVDWQTTQIQELEMSGLVSGDRVMDRDSRRARDGLRQFLDELGRRVLARHGPAPSGTGPDWQVDYRFEFRIVER
jgi:hypothetical protein